MHALSRHPRLLISKISASANPSSKTFPYGTSISSTRRRTVHSARCYCRLDADEELGNKSANTSSSASNRDGPSNIEAPNSPRSTIGSCTRAPGRIRERPSTREAVPGIRSCKRDAHFNGLQRKDTSADHLPLLMTMSANSGPNSKGASALSAVLLGSLVLAPEMQVSGIRGWGRGLEDSKQEDSEVQNCTRGCRDSGLDHNKKIRMVRIRRFRTKQEDSEVDKRPWRFE